MAIRCCNGCVAPKRHPGCHATCSDYIEENKKHTAQREAIFLAKERRAALYDNPGLRATMSRHLSKYKK